MITTMDDSPVIWDIDEKIASLLFRFVAFHGLADNGSLPRRYFLWDHEPNVIWLVVEPPL
jgi:hypothetical protein